MGQKGYFIIKPHSERTTLKLKGDFNGKNTLWVKKAMMASKLIQKSALELDMYEVENIDIQALALITITLKTLKESGVVTRVTGLDETKSNLAHRLGMHYITQIN